MQSLKFIGLVWFASLYLAQSLHLASFRQSTRTLLTTPPSRRSLLRAGKMPHFSLEPRPSNAEQQVDLRQSGAVLHHCAPYIAMHRGSVMVVHITGKVLANQNSFETVMEDISVLALLGIKLILVAGIREQLNSRIVEAGGVPTFQGGLRVTDDTSLRLLQEEAGKARFQIESIMGRGFAGMLASSGTKVFGGNFMYSAVPVGVRNGVDFMHTGEVRRVDTENILSRLNSGDVVLLTSLGFSSSGDMYSVTSESLAAECAARLQASKLIFVSAGERLVEKRHNTSVPVQSLRMTQAKALVEQWAEHSDLPRKLPRTNRNASALAVSAIDDYMRLIDRSIYALSAGVKRAHLVGPERGALLKELFTRDGSGMLIARDMYEGIRQATEEDLRNILGIIRPLEEQGILLPRSNEEVLRDLPRTYVFARDHAILACGMLKQYNGTHAEIACLAVHPQYRSAGLGLKLLAYLERQALQRGVNTVFVLSTRSMQWFEERGFEPSHPSQLPPERSYDASRGSRVYIKHLGSVRDVDAEELLWDIA